MDGYASVVVAFLFGLVIGLMLFLYFWNGLVERKDWCEGQRRKLHEAIVKHRSAYGHDRCWLNDLELYKASGMYQDEPKLPPLPEFMEHCAAYYQGQCGRNA